MSTDVPAGSDPRGEVDRGLGELRERLAKVEQLLAASVDGVPRRGGGPTDAERGERRWPVSVAVLVAIGLQIALPDRLDLGPSWLLPALEAALLVALTAASPGRVRHGSVALRAASVGLVALTSLANAWASIALISDIVSGSEHVKAVTLLSNGGAVYLTNIIVFALWYWEWDRGGPAARAGSTRSAPDFLFPQMTAPGHAPSAWEPTFVDYLYTSYTNATAFSPTDTMPMARWTKLLFLVQSAIALAVAALVIARAVNIFR
jgi:hypothetical protein